MIEKRHMHANRPRMKPNHARFFNTVCQGQSANVQNSVGLKTNTEGTYLHINHETEIRQAEKPDLQQKLNGCLICKTRCEQAPWHLQDIITSRKTTYHPTAPYWRAGIARHFLCLGSTFFGHQRISFISRSKIQCFQMLRSRSDSKQLSNFWLVRRIVNTHSGESVKRTR